MPARKLTRRLQINDHYYIGLDVHKKTITYVIKTHQGQLVRQGSVLATRPELAAWAGAIERPWIGALEATMFSGWVYDELRPLARRLEVAHPLMLQAITCAKKKNDRLDADKICGLLRCNLLPRCYMAPAEIRELRRVLRYRNLLVREGVRMKNKVAGLLMEISQPYVKRVRGTVTLIHPNRAGGTKSPRNRKLSHLQAA